MGNGVNPDAHLHNYTSLGSTSTALTSGHNTSGTQSPGVNPGDLTAGADHHHHLPSAVTSAAAYSHWSTPGQGNPFANAYTTDMNVLYPSFNAPNSQYYASPVPYNGSLAPAVQTGGPTQSTGEQTWKFQVL